jgi:nucleoside-diphosphate-sugar epimerase
VRLLLLGASGFLGRHVSAAAESDADIVLIAHVRSQPAAAGESFALDLLEASPGQIRDVIASARPTAVVNCTGAVTGDASRLRQLNVDLVERLLAATTEATPGARFVQLGSSAEYGSVPRGQPISEAAEAQPVSPYGETKLEATRLVVAAGERGADAVVLRVFNPIGPGMSPATLPGRAARAFTQAREQRLPAVEFGPLDAWRDFVDARDVADAVLVAARAAGRLPPIINIGSGSAVQARTVVRALAAIAGFTGRVVEAGSASPRSTDVPWQCASIDLARRALGWEPRRTLEDALRHLWSGAASIRRG